MKALSPNSGIAQASGIVAIQAGCSVEDALDMMRERADAIGRTLDYVADAVIARKMLFGIRGGRLPAPKSS